jgi:hypothetical protein
MRNFIALKDQSPSAGYESENVGFIGKHANHDNRGRLVDFNEIHIYFMLRINCLQYNV